MDVGSALATLGVAETATWSDVRHAYRTRVQLYHPDTGAGDVQALQSVAAAYNELRDRLSRVEPVVRWPDAPPETGRHIDVYG